MMRMRRVVALVWLGALAVLLVTGCSESKLAISCESFLEKGEEEQRDIAKSFSSESLFRDDEPDEETVVPGTQSNHDELIEYCSDSDNSDAQLDELEVAVGFGP